MSISDFQININQLLKKLASEMDYLFALLKDDALVDVLLSFNLTLDRRLDPFIFEEPNSVCEFGLVLSPEVLLLLVNAAEVREELIEEINDVG